MPHDAPETLVLASWMAKTISTTVSRVFCGSLQRSRWLITIRTRVSRAPCGGLWRPGWLKLSGQQFLECSAAFWIRDVNETRETRDWKKFLGIEKCFSCLLRIYNCATNACTNDRRSVNAGHYAKPPALWPARELGVGPLDGN